MRRQRRQPLRSNPTADEEENAELSHVKVLSLF